MVAVLTLVAAVCGGGLAMVKLVTAERIESQQIRFIKEPALRMILVDHDNDPVADRLRIVTGRDQKGREETLTIFPAKRGGSVVAVALEAEAVGYGGPVKVMIAMDPLDDTVQAMAVTTHSETPGIGSKVVDDPNFSAQFAGKPLSGDFKLRSAGGEIQAITGATMSSEAVSTAFRRGVELFRGHRNEMGL